MKKYLVFILWVLFCGFAQAELEWTVDRVETNLPLGLKEFKATFSYTNSGSSAVEILPLKAFYGNDQVDLNVGVCAPGEGGLIDVTCNVLGQSGKQFRNFRVDTSDGEKNLVVIFDNPCVVSITPKKVSWAAGESGVKTLRFTNLTDTPISITAIRPSFDICSTTVKEIKKGYVYDLLVEPLSEDVVGFSYLLISTDYTINEIPLQFRAYVSIRQGE